MRRQLFEKIVVNTEEHDHYFQQKFDAVGVLGLSCLQKVVAAFRIFAYGTSDDSVDKYVRIGESTALACFKRFAIAVNQIYGETFLRPIPYSKTKLNVKKRRKLI